MKSLFSEKGGFFGGDCALPEGDFSLDWGNVLPPDYEEEARVLSKTAIAVERLYETGVVDEEEARDLLVEMTSVAEME